MIFDGDRREYNKIITGRGCSDFKKENPREDISKGTVITVSLTQGSGWHKIYYDVVNGESVKCISISFQNKAVMYLISSIMNTWSKYV